jgi:hypothetical protein
LSLLKGDTVGLELLERINLPINLFRRGVAIDWDEISLFGKRIIVDSQYR